MPQQKICFWLREGQIVHSSGGQLKNTKHMNLFTKNCLNFLKFYHEFHIAFICGSGSSQKGKYQWIWIQIHNQCCRICILKCRSRSLQKLRSGSRPRSNLSPMHWAQNSDQFTFLKFENLSTGSKIRSQKSWVLFVKKNKFLANSIIKN